MANNEWLVINYPPRTKYVLVPYVDNIMQRGQVTIGVGVLIATGTAIVSTVGGYYAGQITVNDKIGTVQVDVGKLQSDQQNIQQWLERIEGKLDRVIESK